MAAVLKSASCVDMCTGVVLDRTVEELNLGYRSSSVGVSEVVLGAELILKSGSVVESGRLLTEVVRWRRENQPGGQNAGSVFVNPPGDSAGRLIDLAGARGLRIGTAQVSEKHANFIQADTGGSAEDVFRVMNEVRERVRDRCGVDLVAETVLVGFAGAPG
jgi:UDP-N-acetylmuramate dehydrogenase